MTRRTGFICDDCGTEYKHIDPAAFLDGDELCADCYDDRRGDRE